MSAGSRDVIASTVFVPVANPNPIVTAYMRNCRGTVTAGVPDNPAAGHYVVIVPRVLDVNRTSITKRAWTAAGVTRLCAVVLTPNVPVGSTTVDIFVTDEANPNAAADDAAFVEATLAQLPL